MALVLGWSLSHGCLVACFEDIVLVHRSGYCWVASAMFIHGGGEVVLSDGFIAKAQHFWY
jgi:hypothetical protein